MKKLIVVILIFILILVGCSTKEEQKQSTKKESVPIPLKQLEDITEQIVITTTEKDWTASLTHAKDIQMKWNETYPRLQEKSAPKEDVDYFVADLNKLTDSLIIKTLSLPPSDVEQNQKEEDKAEQSQKEEDKSEEESAPASAHAQGDTSNTHSSDGGGASSENEKEQSDDPGKVLSELDPMIELNDEELVIVANAVGLMRHVPGFCGLYGGTVPSDISQLRYLFYQINVSSKQENWAEVNTIINSIQTAWKSLEGKSLETNKNLKLQIDQIIDELHNVVATKNNKLIGVKSNAAIEVLKQLESAFEE